MSKINLTSKQVKKACKLMKNIFPGLEYCWNEDYFRDSPIRALATAVSKSGEVYYRERERDDALEKIKIAFPELYVEVLEAFAKGFYDT